MSNVPRSNPIITIDENDNIVETESNKNTSFERKDLVRYMESVAEQSNAHKFDHINSNSDLDIVQMESNLTRAFTAVLGSLHGLSLEDVNMVMESEKDIVARLQNAITTMSRVFKNSSKTSNEEIDKESAANASRNIEIPQNFSFDMLTNRALSINEAIPTNSQNIEKNSINTLINKCIPMSLQQVKPNNHQQDNLDASIGKKEDLMQISETLSSETRFSVNNVPNYYVPKTKEYTRSSGVKIGDNWELPIIVLDSDDEYDENKVVEVDSDEEEIQEVKKMMSLDDVDCIEIGKDEFELVVNAKKGDSEITDDYEESDEEIFIPVVPSKGDIPSIPSVSKKRRRGRTRTRERSVRQKLSASNVALRYFNDDDPSKWRKDLPAIPYITNDVLRVWATGFIVYRKEWERLEYLGDKVLMFCVLRFATAKYLRYYTPSDIKVVTTFLVSNKLLAAYSLTLGLDKLNQMQRLGITKKVADAFEAYIGAYYLSDGEEATTRYLDQLMSPLFELVLVNIQTGRDPHKIMGVISSYFNMGFLTKISRLSK